MRREGKNIFSCENKGFFHDHLFIPDGLEGRVLEVLEELVLSATAGNGDLKISSSESSLSTESGDDLQGGKCGEDAA